MNEKKQKKYIMKPLFLFDGGLVGEKNWWIIYHAEINIYIFIGSASRIRSNNKRESVSSVALKCRDNKIKTILCTAGVLAESEGISERKSALNH